MTSLSRSKNIFSTNANTKYKKNDPHKNMELKLTIVVKDSLATIIIKKVLIIDNSEQLKAIARPAFIRVGLFFLYIRKVCP